MRFEALKVGELGRRTGLTVRALHHYDEPELKQAIQNNYTQGKFEDHAHAPQAADSAFIQRVKAARQIRE